MLCPVFYILSSYCLFFYLPMAALNALFYQEKNIYILHQWIKEDMRFHWIVWKILNTSNLKAILFYIFFVIYFNYMQKQEPEVFIVKFDIKFTFTFLLCKAAILQAWFISSEYTERQENIFHILKGNLGTQSPLRMKYGNILPILGFFNPLLHVLYVSSLIWNCLYSQYSLACTHTHVCIRSQKLLRNRSL